MKTFTIILALTIIFVSEASFAQETESLADSPEMRAMFEADQSDREGGLDGIDWDIVNRNDAQRREQTLELLRAGRLNTTRDYLHAAYIFQHGNTVDQARLALSLAWISASIDQENMEAREMTAGAWDRLMMRYRQPQWYGTQAEKPGVDAEWGMYEVLEGAISDKERETMGLPPLEELRKHFEEMFQDPEQPEE